MTSSADPNTMSPRAAAVLLTNALGHLDVLQPPEMREPIRRMINAAIEMCVVSRSLLGKSVVHPLRIARVLVDAGTARPVGSADPDL